MAYSSLDYNPQVLLGRLENEDSNEKRHSVRSISSRSDVNDDSGDDVAFFRTEDRETSSVPADTLEEDMYGMVVCSLVRDLYFVQNKIGSPVARFSRLFTTLFLLIVCTSIQVYLLKEVKAVVDAKAVHDIRESYDAFELLMYDDHVLTANGKHRGLGAIKGADVFFDDDLLDEATRSQICSIPLSQPVFCFMVLVIWTLTCITQFRTSLRMLQNIVLGLPTLPDMAGALETNAEEDTDYVVGLSAGVKCTVVLLVILPGICITAFLLWLGCRWLMGTGAYDVLILNAIALEFILCLKDLIYKALVPPRNMRDLARTVINTKRCEATSVMSFLSTLAWGFVAAAFVVMYMGVPDVFHGFQRVLPDYKWDVHSFCQPWIVWRYCVVEPCPVSAYDAYLSGMR